MNDPSQYARRILDTILATLAAPQQWWQMGLFVAIAIAAWMSARYAKRFASNLRGRPHGAATDIVASLLQQLAFPAAFGALCLLGAAVLSQAQLPRGILSAGAALALPLVVIRLLVEAVKRMLKPGPLLAASEHLIAWTIWVIVALYLLGWITPVRGALDSIAIPVGKSRFSLLDAIEAILTLLVFTLVAAWLGTLASRRIMATTQIPIGVRFGISKFLRFFLILLAGLIGLNVLGVDFAALTVFSGALGVGLGFGLQRIAANFISGFILVGDRSIRQGDVITIGDRFGVVKELRARYIVVRDRDGVDTLIPNENVISTEVVNWSYADRAIRLNLPVQISYGDKPREALALLLEAAAKHPRVQKFPVPASRLMGFGDSGVNLELRFWIRDPEDGINNVRSDLYLEIWDLFERAGIKIPFPQRDLHLRSGWPHGEAAALNGR
jgi:small-conductance mechanosensitive channel